MALHAWLASRDEQMRLQSTLAAEKQVLDAANTRERDRTAALNQTIAQIEKLKRETQSPQQIVADLPNYLPLPQPITLSPPPDSSSATKSTATNSTNAGSAPYKGLAETKKGSRASREPSPAAPAGAPKSGPKIETRIQRWIGRRFEAKPRDQRGASRDDDYPEVARSVRSGDPARDDGGGPDQSPTSACPHSPAGSSASTGGKEIVPYGGSSRVSARGNSLKNPETAVNTLGDDCARATAPANRTPMRNDSTQLGTKEDRDKAKGAPSTAQQQGSSADQSSPGESSANWTEAQISGAASPSPSGPPPLNPGKSPSGATASLNRKDRPRRARRNRVPLQTNPPPKSPPPT